MLIKKIQLSEQNPDITLTTYVLDDSKELLNGKRRPAILICPGGAYLNCSDREAEPVALRFAAMGYHAFVLRYSVFFQADEDGFEQLFSNITFTKRDKSLYPAALQDIAKAMTVITDHSEEWFVDKDKIILCGFSAGGHNVLNYAVHYNQPIITDLFDLDKAKPAAVLAGYPITDYHFLMEHIAQQGEIDQKLFALSNLALFGEETPSDAALSELSVPQQVNETTPPMFLWATVADRLVPVGHTTRLATALANVGIPFELHLFEEGQHGLSLATQATSAARTELNPIASEWIAFAEKWLEKRFQLDLKEKGAW